MANQKIKRAHMVKKYGIFMKLEAINTYFYQ